MPREITIALAGNPNSGKSSIFNNLTGARQHVANYPGVTVEKKEGIRRYGDLVIRVVDLPGTYSLTAHSLEEVVARDFIIEEKCDVLVAILDAANIERNLFLATQFLELSIPLVLVLNMADVAVARGIQFDLKMFSERLGVPIVSTVGHKGRGTEELLDTIAALVSADEKRKPIRVDYGRELEKQIAVIQALIENQPDLTAKYPPRWLAIKLLEQDKDLIKKIGPGRIADAIEESSNYLADIGGDSAEILIADRRYGFISGVCTECVRSTIEVRHTMSDKIDSVLIHRVLGMPIFILMMYLVFYLTFKIGKVPMGWIEVFFEHVVNHVATFWPKGSENALKSLIVDGIIGGVGGVIVFVPNIFLLFLAIAVLEDSGYMARAAFIMDALMHKIGLHGKSFIPLLLGFGCTVPAVMAARTIESRRDRLTTIMVAPLMSCSARLPIYTLIIPAFFPAEARAPVLAIMYGLGIVLAVIGAKFLRARVFKGESIALVMELPPYRAPTLRGIGIHAWRRTWFFLRKAGTVILAISMVLWAMTFFPKKKQFEKDYGAITASVEQAYLDNVTEIQKSLGLSESGLLVQAATAKEELESARDKFWAEEFGYKKARQDYEATIERLTGAEGGDILSSFIDIEERVFKLKSRFAEAKAAGDLDENSPEYFAMEHELRANLNEIRKSNPQVYDAVIKHIDEAITPLETDLRKLANEQAAEKLAYSVVGRIGKGVEPVFKPLGFDWRLCTALVGAFAAKEMFVAQLGIVFSVGEADAESEPLQKKLQANYTPLTGFAVMVFMLISLPCIATFVVVGKETGSWVFAVLQSLGLTSLAYCVTLLIYQIGKLAGLGVS